jgi:hypothetical protein
MPSSETNKRRPAKPSAKESEPPADFNVGASLRHTYRFIYQSMREHLAPYLWKEDALTQRELSDRVGTLGPGTVEQLRRMERWGFIKRRASVADRRKVQLIA